MVLGSSRALNEALQHATTELMRWLMDSYGFDERSASLLLGQGMEYEISNVVDPEFTVVAKMRKQYLGGHPEAGGGRYGRCRPAQSWARRARCRPSPPSGAQRAGRCRWSHFGTPQARRPAGAR